MKSWILWLCLSFGIVACQEKVSAPQPPDLMTSSDLLEDEAGVPVEDELEIEDLISDDMTTAEKAAIDLFLFQEGAWKSQWAYFDGTGNVVGEAAGTQMFSFLVDRYSQMVTTVIPSRQHTSYSMRAFSPAEQHIILLNVATEGEYRMMHQNPETGVMISEPKVGPDGANTVLMFTRTKKTDNEVEIIMERSADGGETWIKSSVQSMTRIIED